MKHREFGLSKVAVINTDGHTIGLDIGATCVRAAVLAPATIDGRPTVTVHGLGRVDVPPGTVVNGVVADQAALAAALKHLWQAHRFGCHNVILGIANQNVLVRAMDVPNLPPQQLAKALPFQAREVIALPVDQVILDFEPLGPEDPETHLVPGLLIAGPREPVIAAVAAVERAGLKVARVDLSSFGVLRAIADERLTVEGVIDLGAHLTTIVIHNRGVPKLVRTLARGGQELSDRLVEHIGMSPGDAELAKREAGLTGSNAEVTRVLRSAIRPLLAEIRTSMKYFRTTNDGAMLEQIALTGGGSALPGLAETMAEQFELPVGVVSPMQHIRDPQHSEPNGTASAVSIGLGMGAAA